MGNLRGRAGESCTSRGKDKTSPLDTLSTMSERRREMKTKREVTAAILTSARSRSRRKARETSASQRSFTLTEGLDVNISLTYSLRGAKAGGGRISRGEESMGGAEGRLLHPGA